MQEGWLERYAEVKMDSGKRLEIHSKRFLSIVYSEIGAIRYAIKPLNFDGKITFTPYVDADVMNEDANYDEKFWDEVKREVCCWRRICDCPYQKNRDLRFVQE